MNDQVEMNVQLKADPNINYNPNFNLNTNTNLNKNNNNKDQYFEQGNMQGHKDPLQPVEEIHVNEIELDDGYREEIYNPCGGCLMLFIHLLILGLGIAFLVIGIVLSIVALIVIGPIIMFFALFILMPGLFCLQPNEGVVTLFCGKYYGSIKANGFLWTPPCVERRGVSLKSNNFETDNIKVNDLNGNPIQIGAVVIWKVDNTAKVMFDIENLDSFVKSQSETAIRKLASSYPYDKTHDDEISLKDGGEEVNQNIVRELQERLAPAGVIVEEARLNRLAYSEEIAHLMLKRQQADAIIGARQKIVNGGVGIVHMALDNMKSNDICDMNREERVKLASNLLVVLCSDNQVSPIVNTGS